MPKVQAKPNESPESVLRRFKRSCDKAGVINECRRRERHVKRTTQRAQQKAAAIKRHLKKLAKERPQPSRGVSRSVRARRVRK